MSLPPPVLYSPSRHGDSLIAALVRIHTDCVVDDGTLATFLPRADGSMDTAQLEAFWREKTASVGRGEREICLQFATADDGNGATTPELAGYVCLAMPRSQTGPFRGLVETLLVSPRHRRKGVARRVMGLLQETARARHRELLILDTTIGSGAEHVYPRLGFTSFGIIPKYGIHPHTGKLVDELFFYKDLRNEQ